MRVAEKDLAAGRVVDAVPFAHGVVEHPHADAEGLCVAVHAPGHVFRGRAELRGVESAGAHECRQAGALEVAVAANGERRDRLAVIQQLVQFNHAVAAGTLFERLAEKPFGKSIHSPG